MKKVDPRYLDHVRRRFLKKLSNGKLTLESFSLHWQRESAGSFWVGFADQLEDELETWRPETLAKVVSFALQDDEKDRVNFRRLSINSLGMWEQFPGWNRNGQGILADIAAAVILLSIWELLQVRYLEVGLLNVGHSGGGSFEDAGKKWLEMQ